MNKLKCKDYIIFKVRFYANNYYLKKFHNNETIGRKKHWEAAKNHTEFFWNFINRTTGNYNTNYYEKYPLDTRECMIEEIHETYGIIVVGSEGYYTYFIPKENINLVQWMKENLKNPYKILKKTNSFFIDTTPTTWRRERSNEFKNKKNIPDIGEQK